MSVPTEMQIKAEDELMQSRNFSSSSLAALLSFWKCYCTTTRLTEKFKTRYRAATIAFMAGVEGWHVSSDARKANRRRVFETVLDMLTALDCVSGGATIMLHVDGNQIPGSQHVPEAVKADVYFTPHIRHENPNGEVFVVQAAQAFIELIALPCIQRWERAMAGALDDAINKANPFCPVKPSESAGTSSQASPKSLLKSMQTENADLHRTLEEAQARIAELEARLSEKESLLDNVMRGLSAIQANAGQLQADIAGPSAPNVSSPRATQSKTYEHGSNVSAHHSSTRRPHDAFVRVSSPVTPSPLRPAPHLPSALGVTEPASPAPSQLEPSASFIPDSPKVFGPACDAAIQRFGMLPYVHTVLWNYHERLHNTQWHFHMIEYLELEKEEALLSFVSFLKGARKSQMDDLNSWPPFSFPSIHSPMGPPWMYENPTPNEHRDVDHGGHIAPLNLPNDKHQLSAEGTKSVAPHPWLLPNSYAFPEVRGSDVLHDRDGPTLDESGVNNNVSTEKESFTYLAVPGHVPTPAPASDNSTSVGRQTSSPDPGLDPAAQQNACTQLPPAHIGNTSNMADTLPPKLHAKLKLKDRQARKNAFDVDFDNLFQQLRRGISKIAEKHNKKESHIENLFFNGGTRYLNIIKPSVWNAWLHYKYQEVNADVPVEERIPLCNVQRDYANEYYSLTEEEKQHYVHVYKAYRDEKKSAPRPTAREKIQDVVNTSKKIEQLMIGLDNRVGIQGMFCIVRSSTDFAMDPRWFFTSTELEKYLEIAVRKWDTPKIGAQIEAYAVAGGSITGLLRTSKMKARWLKSQIRDKISALLVEITGNENVKMNYVSFEEAIVERFHIILEGWPSGIAFTNPSELSDTLPPLQSVVDALTSGMCKFVRISEAQVQARRERIAADIASGKKAPRKPRKQRKDAGVARGPRTAAGSRDLGEEESESEDKEEERREDRSQKRQRKA
ncbi:hypothetical protein BC835DRAFT_1419558 [Cytidiella melzeri]|nr:hypothetical protein BC835DRAFT_1419558 [Cytidiella melzeri]